MVKKFCGTVGVYTRRGVLSFRFWGCAAISALLMISFVLGDYISDGLNAAMYYFYMGVETSGSNELLIMLAAMPAITLFCDDRNSGEFFFLYTRTGKRIYPLAVTLSSAIIAAFSIIVSYLIFSAFILARYPLVPAMSAAELRQETLGMWNCGLLTSVPAAFYVLWIALKGAIAAIYAALGILLSVFITNVHLTLVSPMLTNLIDGLFVSVINPPFWINSSALYGFSLSLYLGFGGTLDGELFSVISAVYPFVFAFIAIIALSLITGKAITLKINSKLGVGE